MNELEYHPCFDNSPRSSRHVIKTRPSAIEVDVHTHLGLNILKSYATDLRVTMGELTVWPMWTWNFAYEIHAQFRLEQEI